MGNKHTVNVVVVIIISGGSNVMEHCYHEENSLNIFDKDLIVNKQNALT